MICGVQKFRKLFFFLLYFYMRNGIIYSLIGNTKKENEYGVCKMELSGIREILL